MVAVGSMALVPRWGGGVCCSGWEQWAQMGTSLGHVSPAADFSVLCFPLAFPPRTKRRRSWVGEVEGSW